MVKLTINGRQIEAKEKTTVLEVTKELGINIPTLCHDDRLSKETSCRLCVVEVNGGEKLLTSCNLEVAEGMVIETHSDKVIEARKHNLSLLWGPHPNECVVCEKSGECKLEEYNYEYDIDVEPIFDAHKRNQPKNESNHFFEIDPRKCILCGKCIRMCDEQMQVGALGYVNRGNETFVTFANEDFDEANCVSCGNCVSVCPTGALMPKSKSKYRNWNTTRTKTTCPYCGVGCQMELVVTNGEVVRVEPVVDAVNNGLLCVKGKFAFNFINHPNRLKTPLIKRNGVFEEATWDEAYSLIKEKVDLIKKDYPNSFAGLSSARCTNEENYLFQKMMRAVFGTNNVDHCARLCHASTVTGLGSTLGSGAMTNSISEVLDHDVIFIAGSNTTSTHPVIGSFMKQAQANGAKVIVAEPREIELAENADVFIQIQPGSNVALFKGMMHYIYKNDLQDEEFIRLRTEGFEEFIKSIEDFTTEEAAQICGCKKEDIEKAAEIYAKGKKAGIYYSMGVTQHSQGTNGVKSVANLAMLCGHVGKESSGINPLRGQNNVQGACDLGALPNNFTGYQKVFDDLARAKFESAWGVKLDSQVGLTVPKIIDGMVNDEIKFLYIMGENPMISDPDINHVKNGLERVDFLVVQDIFLTETAEFADVVLPASSYAEKTGTFTNTERKIQLVNKVIEPTGNSKPDWIILKELMTELGYPQAYSSPSDIMDEIASLTPIYGGVNYDRVSKSGLQWPCFDESHPGTKYLHKGKFSRGKGLFTPVEYISPMEVADDEYPITLTTGRTLYHYHTATMTNKTEGINKIVPENFFEVSKETAKKYNLINGAKTYVSSRRGTTIAVVKVVDTIKDDVIFMPFHFANGANVLTNTALDQFCDIPELKVCAVKFDDKL
ncbi:formate dehydrogenase subunit alpha [Mycoplasmatota bacterium zrk1]